MKRRFRILGLILVLLTVSLLVFAACNSSDVKKIKDAVQNKGKLSAPTSFDYDGKYVSWGKVENATSYVVTLNGGTELSYNGTNCRYENSTGEDFTVTIKAKAQYYDDSDVASCTFSPIGAVTGLTVKPDGTLEWDEVQYADSYEVTVGKTKTVVSQTTFSDLPVGTSQIIIRAKRASEQGIVYYSTGSATKSVEIIGDVDPQKITYKEGSISWVSVSGAQSYELYINDELEEGEVIGTKYDFDSHNGNFSVGIKAIGNHTSTFDGKNVVKKNFVYLDAPTGVVIEDGALVWQPVKDAESYTLKVDGAELRQAFTECKYAGIRAGQETRIQIKANSTDTAYYASWTDEKTFLILGAPEIRWVEGNLDGNIADTIVWDAVSGANGYAVSLKTPDGRQSNYDLSLETRAYGNAYLDAGEYTVSVKAVAEKNSGNVYDSAYSQPIKVVRLAAPKAANSDFIKSYPDNVANGFDVTFNAVSGATNYELWRDDTRVNSTTSGTTQFARVNDFVDDASMAEKVYTYRIKSLGSSYNSSKRMRVLDCLSSATLNFNITVLAMPDNVKMEGFNVTYDSVSKASQYTIDIGSGIKTSETTSYSLDQLNAGSYQVRVNARGNRADILSSNYTVAINVVRLAAPENIRISVDGSEGYLLFDGPEEAASYELVINGERKEVAASNVENIAKDITTSGTQMHLRAIRNDYALNGTYFMTSQDSQTKTFTKLPAPTFGTSAFSNTQLIWNAVTAFSDYTPTYKVYDESDIAYNGTMKGATMDISYLDGGKSYNFKVKAIGDGTRYINSDLSVQKSVKKLATPAVKVNDDKDAYTWRSVSGTSNYAVYIDGVISDLEIHNYGDDYTFKPGFTKVKSYQVKFIAKGDDGVSTIDSDAFVIEQQTQQLDTPEFTFCYTADTVGEGVIQITVSKAAPYAAGYVYGVGKTQSEETTATVFENDPNNVGSYALSLYAVGGKFDENDVYYVDSRVFGGNDNYTITLLPQPNVGDISINRDGELSWTTVSGASSYALTLSVDGTEYNKTVKQGNTFDIAAMLAEESKSWSEVSKVVVSIVAKGADYKAVNSVATEKTFNDITH